MNRSFRCSGAVSASKSKDSAVTDRRYSGSGFDRVESEPFNPDKSGATRFDRKESERFRSFPYEELLKRDKRSTTPPTCPASLDTLAVFGVSRRRAGARQRYPSTFSGSKTIHLRYYFGAT